MKVCQYPLLLSTELVDIAKDNYVLPACKRTRNTQDFKYDRVPTSTNILFSIKSWNELPRETVNLKNSKRI